MEVYRNKSENFIILVICNVEFYSIGVSDASMVFLSLTLNIIHILLVE